RGPNRRQWRRYGTRLRQQLRHWNARAPGRHNTIFWHALDLPKLPPRRIPVSDEPSAVYIQHPVFRDSGTRVKIALDRRVELQGSVRYFDDERQLISSRVPSPVVSLGLDQNCEVRLGQTSFLIRNASFDRYLS